MLPVFISPDLNIVTQKNITKMNKRIKVRIFILKPACVLVVGIVALTIASLPCAQ